SELGFECPVFGFEFGYSGFVVLELFLVDVGGDAWCVGVGVVVYVAVGDSSGLSHWFSFAGSTIQLRLGLGLALLALLASLLGLAHVVLLGGADLLAFMVRSPRVWVPSLGVRIRGA